MHICLHQFYRYTRNALRSIEFEVCTESAITIQFFSVRGCGWPSHHGQAKDCLAPNSDQKKLDLKFVTIVLFPFSFLDSNLDKQLQYPNIYIYYYILYIYIYKLFTVILPQLN